jgi:hypothetical protein
VVRAEEDTIHLRDLRTRNFDTTFGDLELTLDEDRRVVGKRFHV